MATTRARYQIRKARSGWYVIDTHTGAVRTGLVHAGAIRLADHLNRNA